MKKKMIIPIAVTAIMGIYGAANASNYCVDWGEANIVGRYTEAQMRQCTSENATMGWYPNCATLDSAYTYIFTDEDGTCRRIDSCATCPSGYHLDSEVFDGITIGDVCYYAGDDKSILDIWEASEAGRLNLYACVQDCASCTNCNSTDWAAYGTGYEKRTERRCNCGVCESDIQYRCAVGYYGGSTNGTSGCTRCPALTGVYTNSTRTTQAYGTSAVGSGFITGCYIPTGTYYDVSGTFTMTAKCSYVK